MDVEELISNINKYSKLRIELREVKYGLECLITKYLMQINELNDLHVDIAGLGYVDDPSYTNYRCFNALTLSSDQKSVEVEYEDSSNDYCFVTIPLNMLLDPAPVRNSLKCARELHNRILAEAEASKEEKEAKRRYALYLELKGEFENA